MRLGDIPEIRKNLEQVKKQLNDPVLMRTSSVESQSALSLPEQKQTKDDKEEVIMTNERNKFLLECNISLNTESFVNNEKKLTNSLKITTLGAGMCGINLTNTFINISPTDANGKPIYQGLGIVSTESDISKLTVSDMLVRQDLKGLQKGCAREPHLAKAALPLRREVMRDEVSEYARENSEDLVNYLKKIDTLTTDLIIINVGQGGGTGTGLMFSLIEHTVTFMNELKQKGELVDVFGKPKTIPIGVAFSIPKEDPAEIKIAAQHISNELSKLLERKLINFAIPIDNKFMYEAYEDTRDLAKENKKFYTDSFFDYTNRIIVNTLHESIVSGVGGQGFDANDAKRVIAGQVGILSPNKQFFYEADIPELDVTGDDNTSVEDAFLEIQEGEENFEGEVVHKSFAAKILDGILNPKHMEKLTKDEIIAIGINIVVTENNFRKISALAPQIESEIRGQLKSLDIESNFKVGVAVPEDYTNEEILVYSLVKSKKLPDRITTGLAKEYKEILESKEDTTFSGVSDDGFDVFNISSAEEEVAATSDLFGEIANGGITSTTGTKGQKPPTKSKKPVPKKKLTAQEFLTSSPNRGKQGKRGFTF